MNIGPKKKDSGEGNTIELAAGEGYNPQAFHGRPVAVVSHSRNSALSSFLYRNNVIANNNPLFVDLSVNYIQKYSSNVKIIVGVKGVNHFGKH
ncbi:MAG TPA: hypothetical protein PKZ12_00305 [Smithellaceae bacterium]|nr:hypothetical protein [Smithellaceae bacterium]